MQGRMDIVTHAMMGTIAARNFKTRLGQLDLLLSPSGRVLKRVVHV